jgi:predicted metal-dependent hydrolase
VVGAEIHLFVRNGSTRAVREKAMTRFYGNQVQAAVLWLLLKWEPLLQVTTKKVRVQKMKSRWGSCIPARRIIKFNTELAKWPVRFLDYVVLHELVHYLEPGHGLVFKALMTRYLPNWRLVRRELKSGRSQ